MTHVGVKSPRIWRVFPIYNSKCEDSQIMSHPVTRDLSNLECVFVRRKFYVCRASLHQISRFWGTWGKASSSLQPYIKIQVTEVPSPCPIVRCLMGADGRPNFLTSCKGFSPLHILVGSIRRESVCQEIRFHPPLRMWLIYQTHWRRARTQSWAIRLLKSLGIDASVLASFMRGLILKGPRGFMYNL